MKGSDVLRIVDQMHHEKNIDREIIFSGIEAALQLASEKKFGEESGVTVKIDRDTGDLHVRRGEEDIDPMLLGRISAQSAKQVMIQKIREAECNSVYEEYVGQKGDLVTGPIVRHEGGAGIVTLGKTEAILPRSEQIPGESHHVGERVKAVVLDVKKAGTRVKIILSRTHPEFVRRLFENEIPEIQDRTIEIRAVAREAGYRCKIAVSSIDLKVDCVGACVGVRGSRIKNVVDELGGERIDIVRWNDSLQVMIPNALQPASVDEVFLYGRLGRAIVLVKEDQLSLAIGRRGQNVRLASKLVGWDIEIMTIDELNESVERADRWFKGIPGMPDEAVERYIEEGFLSFDDLTFIEPAEMAEMTGLDEDTCGGVIEYAEEMALKIERFGDPGARRGGRGAAAAQGEAAAEGESADEGEAGAEGEAPAEGAEGEAPAEGDTPAEETTGDMAVEHADTPADGKAAAEEHPAPPNGEAAAEGQEGHGAPHPSESH